METVRKPLQGVKNIVKFNWHFYVIVILALFILGYLYFFYQELHQTKILIFGAIILLPVVISLLVSYYVYDASGFYTLRWMKIENTSEKVKILNINAGFDETSDLLKNKFPNSEMTMVDFYDEKKHTEISIKRARKSYPNPPETITIKNGFLPFEDHSVDFIFLVFSAHEIRDHVERILFFKEIRRVLKHDGTVMVTEHLRDFNNFVAYNVGFFHFLPMKFWKHTFSHSHFIIAEKTKINPFVTTFYLKKYGASS